MMIVAVCSHEHTKKFGKDRKGNPRMRCNDCGQTWTVQAPKMFGDMRIEKREAVFALKLLLEGMSIRSVERLTGIHRDRVCELVSLIGQRCKRFLASRIQDVKVKEIECDETWGFIGAKQKTCERLGHGPEMGDCYTYIAMERNTKLVLTWSVGKRGSEECWSFIDDLKFATKGRFQISTDGYRPYQAAIPLVFNFNVDYSQVVKYFNGVSDVQGSRRYSPANIVATEITTGCGNPDLDRACTSHSERLNLSIRMGVRRMTRLTNAHSKKWANHEAMLGLWFAFYNFVRVHSTIKTTPAVANGLTERPWTLEELLAEVANY